MTSDPKRSCVSCKHVDTSPAPCADCIFSKELPRWEARTPAEAGLTTSFKPDEPAPRLGKFLMEPGPVQFVPTGGLDGTDKENPKARYGRSKPQLGLIPGAALIELAGAMELGAIKYGACNWRDDPVEAATYMHAAWRHMLSWYDGEDIDPESGRSHLAHAMACMAILSDAGHVGSLIDNRPTKGVSGALIRERTKDVS